MDANDPGDFAQRNVRFFRALAVIAGAGVVAALVLGLGGIAGPGWFQIGPAVTSALLIGMVIVIVLILFLLRISTALHLEMMNQPRFGVLSHRGILDVRSLSQSE